MELLTLMLLGAVVVVTSTVLIFGFMVFMAAVLGVGTDSLFEEDE